MTDSETETLDVALTMKELLGEGGSLKISSTQMSFGAKLLASILGILALILILYALPIGSGLFVMIAGWGCGYILGKENTEYIIEVNKILNKKS